MQKVVKTWNVVRWKVCIIEVKPVVYRFQMPHHSSVLGGGCRCGLESNQSTSPGSYIGCFALER